MVLCFICRWDKLSLDDIKCDHSTTMQSGMSQSQASFDPAMVERQRYMTQMQRRSMPPRCHPLSIVAMVLCLGMVFLGEYDPPVLHLDLRRWPSPFILGLTMTVIAHWPGNSSIGDNPLKKVGPALLGIGGCFFIAGLIGICWWQTNKKEAWQQSMQQLAQSRRYLLVEHSYSTWFPSLSIAQVSVPSYAQM